MSVIQRLLIKWFRADETVTDGIGWAGNLAIFRIVYLSAAVLPFTWDLVRWTMEAMPWLPAASWQPISFYQWIPTDVLRNTGLAHALAVVDLCLVVLATVGFFTRSTLTAAVGVIAFETGALSLVLFSWSRWLVVLAGLAFHWGNGLVLGIWFSSLCLGYVCMVDWVRLGRFAMRTVGCEPVLVMYDGGCGLCRRTIAILKTLDICGELTPLAADSSDPRRRSHLEITDAMLVRDLYVVGEADIAGGYDAYKTIAARIPILWPIALVMRFPAVAAIGNRIYRHIADSRHCQIRGMSHSSPLVGRRLLRRAPHFVGIMLIILETITFSLNSGLAFRLATLGTQFPAHTFTRWKKEKCLWPFDQYPTFAYSATGFYQTWEPRLVYVDGSESGISPEAWARSFGDWGISQFNALESVDDANPAQRKERALTVASLLWRNLANSRRLNAVAIRGYRTSFSNDPDDVRPASRILVDSFPAPLLRASAFQSSNADLVQRTTGFNPPP